MVKFAPVPAITLVQALSLILLVANHARLWREGLHGGLNGLLLVSGIVMGTLAFRHTTRETLNFMRRFSVRVLVPSIAVTLLYFAVRQNGSWAEILMVSNWLTRDRIVLFPIWYIQALIQMFLVIGILFWLFDLTPRLRANPEKGTLIAYAAAVALCLFSYAVWDTAYLQDKLPQLIAWNFILGWVIWAFLINGSRTLFRKVLLSAVLLFSEYVIFIIAGAAFGP